MRIKGTERHRCWRCHKLVLVANPTPCEEETRILLNGMWLSRMNEVCEEKTIGVLCVQCVFEDSWNGEEWDLCVGFCGGEIANLDNWGALITLHKVEGC